MFRIALAVFSSALIQSVVAVVPVYEQCGGTGWTGETTCASGSTCVYQNEYLSYFGDSWYSQCVPTVGSTPTTTKPNTTTKPTTTTKSSITTSVTSAPTGITTILPASAGYVALPTASIISGSFDGRMVKYDRAGSSGECQGQTETGEEDAVFILESGASISNVIVGKDQAEGIHCRGPCTVTNVWWEDVCEDAITLKQTGSGDITTITGGGAFHAEDKIVQHNGAGRVVIRNFFASDFGKLYRSCGNCQDSYERHVTVDNVCMHDGDEGIGINSNFGDTAALSNIKTNGDPSGTDVCCTYEGVPKGSEPPKIGCGNSYTACQYSAFSVGSC